MEVIFLGTSCMVPTKERNHQSIFVSYKDTGLLIDCGEGTQRQLKIAGIKPSKINKIFISHWHGDHVLGLPGLLQTMSAGEYEKTLEIYGPKNTKKYFEFMFKAFNFKIGFDYTIKELSDTSLTFKNIKVNSLNLNHSVPCLGYSIIENDRRKIKTSFIKELNIPDGPLLGELQNNKKIKWKNKTIDPNDATYLIKGKKLTIVLDTLECKNAYTLANDSDLLIGEAVYSHDLLNKANEYKHMTARQTAQIAAQSNVKRLILTHLSQRYKTSEELLEEAKTVFNETIVAYDFLKIKI